MKRILIGGMILFACGCSNQHGPMAIFKKQSPHDTYEQHLIDAGLAGSALARGWHEKAAAVLTSPLTIELPYKETGYFPADNAEAAGFSFSLKRGQKLIINFTRRPAQFMIYADLFFANQLVASADSSTLSFEVKTSGLYVLRLQPELLAGGEYTLKIMTGPALHFPVSASGHPKIEGFWGDGRDDNSRKHEGIDIFAPKGTPALAAANGTVVHVGENKLGGLVVLMEPYGADYTLYYAHLGVQLVHEGQQVKADDTLGLIDNTGNAKNTPSHLHFGIYTEGRAIDPLLFVKPANEILPSVSADLSKLNTEATLNQVPVKILAASKNDYKVSMPNGQVAVYTAKSLNPLIAQALIIHHTVPLYARPDTSSSRMLTINSGTKVSVRGFYGGFELVSYKDLTGWVQK